VKVLIQRKERIRLQFAEPASQLLLDAVDRVEKIAAVHFEPSAAQFPVGAQQKVESKDAVLELSQRSFADEAEVRAIFFVLAAPCASPVLTRHRVQRDSTDVLFPCGALAEAFQAGAKNSPKHTVAGMGGLVPADS
jgi:hypothetical protein